jgi:cytochrome d ubiquinol oxidase subunit II
MVSLEAVLYALIALSLALYFLLDGYTLGIGLNMPLLRNPQARETAIHSVTPFWDANQTWLVFAVAALYGAFPTFYSVILPTFYIEIIVLLMLLFVRGIVFEFYEKFSCSGFLQALLFVTALIAAFLQGAIATQLLLGQGLTDEPGHGDIWQYAGILGGSAFILGYAVLGSAWLQMSQPDSEAKIVAYPWALGISAFVAIVLWIAFCLTEQPFLAVRLAERAEIILCIAAASLLLPILLRKMAGTHTKPFIWVISPLILLSSAGSICLYPDLLIPGIRLQNVAAPHASLIFLLVGLAIALPVIIAYTLYSYWSLLKR